MVKSERLTIKLLPSDKQALVALAALEGEPVAVLVRRLIRQAAREAQARGEVKLAAVQAPEAERGGKRD